MTTSSSFAGYAIYAEPIFLIPPRFIPQVFSFCCRRVLLAIIELVSRPQDRKADDPRFIFSVQL